MEAVSSSLAPEAVLVIVRAGVGLGKNAFAIHGATTLTKQTRVDSAQSINWERRFPTNEQVARARLSSGFVVSHDNMTVRCLASPSVWLKSTRSFKAEAWSAIRQSNRRLRMRMEALCFTAGNVLVVGGNVQSELRSSGGSPKRSFGLSR